MEIEDLARDVHEISCWNGWFDREGVLKNPDVPLALQTEQERKEAALSLLHAIGELAEATTELSIGHTGIREVGGVPKGLPIELADALMVILSVCQAYQIPIVEALAIKMRYEATRVQRSGGKLF